MSVVWRLEMLWFGHALIDVLELAFTLYLENQPRLKEQVPQWRAVLLIAMDSTLTLFDVSLDNSRAQDDFIPWKLAVKRTSAVVIQTKHSPKKNNFSDRDFKSIQVLQWETTWFLNTPIPLAVFWNPSWLMLKRCHINGTDGSERLLWSMLWTHKLTILDFLALVRKTEKSHQVPARSLGKILYRHQDAGFSGIFCLCKMLERVAHG